MAGIAETSAAAEESALMRMGLFSALAIAIHNFPEGLATFVGALQDPPWVCQLPLPLQFTIFQGIAVSVPIFFATGSRRKAFLLLIPVRPV